MCQGDIDFAQVSTNKHVLCLVAQSCLTLCDPMDHSPPGSCPWGFSRQEYWSGLPCLPSGDLPNPRIEPRSPAFQVDFFIIRATREVQKYTPIPSPGDLPNSRIELGSPVLQADSLPAEPPGKPTNKHISSWTVYWEPYFPPCNIIPCNRVIKKVNSSSLNPS